MPTRMLGHPSGNRDAPPNRSDLSRSIGPCRITMLLTRMLSQWLSSALGPRRRVKVGGGKPKCPFCAPTFLGHTPRESVYQVFETSVDGVRWAHKGSNLGPLPCE